VGALEKASINAHRRVNFIIYLVQALAALFTSCSLVRALADYRRSPADRFTRRSPPASGYAWIYPNDEVGELVSAFNSTRDTDRRTDR
jgi:HAMP domain-containing protein